MIDLKPYFITTDRPFTEGAVEVFEQAVPGQGRATLTITALGLYEAEINGRKVGDALFTPGYTYYPRRLNVQTYDVTGLLEAQNTLTVYLAQGWYCGRYTFKNRCQIYGERPAVSWVLTIGERVYTSRDSVTAAASPYDYAGFYDGEVYNEKREQRLYPPVPYTGQTARYAGGDDPSRQDAGGNAGTVRDRARRRDHPRLRPKLRGLPLRQPGLHGRRCADPAPR